MAAVERILCVGTGNPETNPGSARRENSRAYRYALPGTVCHYGGPGTTPEIGSLPESPLVSVYPGGPAILGWGLIVIEDTYSKNMKPIVESGGVAQPPEWETIIIKARDRALDLLNRWANPFPKWNYGALLIKGDLPTENEIERAIENRRSNVLEHLNWIINDQTLAARGHKPSQRGYRQYKAWAKEYGVYLPETVDTLEKVAVEEVRMPCPECGEAILPAAKVCIHCKTKFRGFTVSEMIANHALEEATRPTVNA